MYTCEFIIATRIKIYSYSKFIWHFDDVVALNPKKCVFIIWSMSNWLLWLNSSQKQKTIKCNLWNSIKSVMSKTDRSRRSTERMRTTAQTKKVAGNCIRWLHLNIKKQLVLEAQLGCDALGQYNKRKNKKRID